MRHQGHITPSPSVDRPTPPGGALCIAPAFVVATLALLTPCELLAAPATLALQGALTSSGGGPVSDGKYGVSVSIWDAAQGGQALYGENVVGVTVSNGSFSVVLGADKQTLARAMRPVTTSLTRHRRAEYPFTAAHSHQVNHAPI